MPFELQRLFHWAVPRGRGIEAGCEIGRFGILTHCYWRDAGPEMNDVNIMAVAHGETKEQVLAHKVAIDTHICRSSAQATQDCASPMQLARWPRPRSTPSRVSAR